MVSCGSEFASTSHFLLGRGASRQRKLDELRARHNGAFVHAKTELTTSIAKISGLDGASHTFLFGEVDYGLTNLAPGDPPNSSWTGGSHQWAHGYFFGNYGSISGVFNATELAESELFRLHELLTFRNDHPGGVVMVMADASASFVSEETSDAVLDAHATRNGGELPTTQPR
ncbi:MAG: DUF1559 domain-containing protein [Planctomycetota bacterium]